MFEKKNIKVRTYQGKHAQTAASTALKHRLYVSGWALSGHLQDIKIGYKLADSRISLAWYQDIPVAVAISQGDLIMAFCRKALRRNGLASRCVSAIKTNNTIAQRGIDGSEIFWDKHKIHCFQ